MSRYNERQVCVFRTRSNACILHFMLPSFFTTCLKQQRNSWQAHKSFVALNYSTSLTSLSLCARLLHYEYNKVTRDSLYHRRISSARHSFYPCQEPSFIYRVSNVRVELSSILRKLADTDQHEPIQRTSIQYHPRPTKS